MITLTLLYVACVGHEDAPETKHIGDTDTSGGSDSSGGDTSGQTDTGHDTDTGFSSEPCSTVTVSYDHSTNGSTDAVRTYLYADDAAFSNPEWAPWAAGVGTGSLSTGYGDADFREDMPDILTSLGGHPVSFVGQTSDNPDYARTIDFSWDADGQLVAQTLSDYPLTTSMWTWDADHGVVLTWASTSEDPEQVGANSNSTYTWDGEGRMLTRTYDRSDQRPYVYSWTYNDAGQVTSYGYDTNGDGTHDVDYSYDYNDDGTLASYEETIGGSTYRTHTYTYTDGLPVEELIVDATSSSTWRYSWTYNDADLVLTWYIEYVGRDDLQPVGYTYAYDDSGRILSAVCDNPTYYTSDAWAGNCTPIDMYSWSWDDLGRVESYRNGDQSNEGYTAYFAYDGGC